ncbi:3-phosphoshikimate 1-carboxyvinyltransferase [Leadbettera azotonutricia]|uniref:3-phosphoshikimate 1-carboxyvinyltransferase n=1 Tax=Leadbettera azotonutricia TaxID=150829 RepID=UPI0005C63911|nr:3-phosphoshikimate 1-carboxyvinyltransferase [Leadbettera azotonutricia]
MNAVISPHALSGTFRIPASKSHTIRRLLIAALAPGPSIIDYPLDSLDARSCVSVCRALGAEIEEFRAIDPSNPNPQDSSGKKLIRWTVKGIKNQSLQNSSTAKQCDVGNSGTTLYLALAVAALGSEPVSFDGDEQIRRRSAGPLLDALKGLGVKVESAANGCAPISVQGPWKGGRVSLECPTSQYLSALLLAAPLAVRGLITEIDVPLLNERPYIEMTLSYLDAQHIPYETANDFSYFRVPGGAEWKPMNGPVPGDFSSAAFPACAAAITGGPVTLLGLDPDDPQGDKAVFSHIEKMGASVKWEKISAGGKDAEWKVTVSRSSPLRGGTFDLNATPDMLPAMAVTAAFAQGDTALTNVAHARIKETDRIAVMAAELSKLGVICTEKPDGLIIHGKGGTLHRDTDLTQTPLLDGHGDHRIVMALAVAGLGARPLEIAGAEAADVTYPGFLDLLQARGRGCS